MSAYVEMLENLGTAEECLERGEIYEVPDSHAVMLEIAGIARRTATPPEHVRRFLEALDEHADEPVLFLPFCGEFGHLVMSHLRLVHFHRSKSKIVCCRRGEEVLFPSAESCVTDWVDPVPDAVRIATLRGRPIDWSGMERRFPGRVAIASGQLTPAQELIAIEPRIRIPFRPSTRGLRADVLLATRRRPFAPERNWPHWQSVADVLRERGISFAVVGDRATGFDLAGSTCFTGDYDTDLAIELMQHCRLFVGTDSGASHLAATVGCEMLLFRNDRDGSRDMFGRMQEVNPGRISAEPHGWDRPAEVSAAIVRRLTRG